MKGPRTGRESESEFENRILDGWLRLTGRKRGENGCCEKQEGRTEYSGCFFLDWKRLGRWRERDSLFCLFS